MCGILGELFPSVEAASPRFVSKASLALAHRGPDASGLVQVGPCVLGHRRLSILDLDERAAQPMLSASKRTAIVFNGEIYNYLELKKLFDPPPGGWRTQGDTEVLLELWERQGLAALSGALGMFAFAAYDANARELWLVRDRLGKKPLYWAWTRSKTLRFASELPALLVDDEVPRETTADRLAEFLQYGYVAGPRTGLSSVHVVPPGTALVVSTRDGVLRTRAQRYWALPFPAEAASHERWLELFRDTLENAVRIRLRADVPLGAFLSGGVDSSVVALLASRQSETALSTYTADFPDPRLSEARWAAEVAAHLGTTHHTLMVSQPANELPRQAVDVYGDLHGDPSAIPTLAVCRAMRSKVTVALSGDGGDELLGGYARYAATLRTLERATDRPLALAAAAPLLARAAPSWLGGTSRLMQLERNAPRAYAAQVRAYPLRGWPPVVARPRGETDPVIAAMLRNEVRSPLKRMLATDVETYLPEDNLIKVDRASMSVGLEVRSPLLDHRLFELVMAAPDAWLSDLGGTKKPLQALYAAQLPKAVFERAKMGFAPPVLGWMKAISAKQTLARISQSGLSAALDLRSTKRELEAFELGLHRSAGRPWQLLVALEWWNRWNPTLLS